MYTLGRLVRRVRRVRTIRSLSITTTLQSKAPVRKLLQHHHATSSLRNTNRFILWRPTSSSSSSSSVDPPSHLPTDDQTDPDLQLIQQYLHKSGNKQGAKRQIQSLLSLGKATTTHCQWALKNVSTGEKFDYGLLSAMQEHGILIDEETSALVEANRQQRIRADQLFSAKEMEKLKYHLAEYGKEQANTYFKTMQRYKRADATHYGWAMTNVCQTSHEIRVLLNSMTPNGVAPNTSNFTILINRYINNCHNFIIYIINIS